MIFFYKSTGIFSFKNIDRFSTSGLVTRMTTDITNVQMAYMMSIRLLARAPIMIVLSWIMTLLINKKNCFAVPDHHTAAWRNTDLYCKESASTFYQSI